MAEKVVLAGSAGLIDSLTGHEEILKAFSSIGMAASFIETPFVKKYFKNFSFMENAGIPFAYTDTPPADSLVIPLSEYWISRCIKSGCCAISLNALKASRSKKFLYEKLSSAGITTPHIFKTCEEARSFIKDKNKKVIVKPEGLFSGYAVKTVSAENENRLEEFSANAGNVRNNAVKLFQIENKTSLITELIEGDEYSADLFLFRGRISLVRLCKKVVAEIHGTPCTLICQLIPCTPDFFEQLKKWCTVLFNDTDISFAQFDFIECCGTLVPIDFACRAGGGMKELFSECPSNVYAGAVMGKNYEAEADGGYLSQFNYVPTKSGIISDDDYNLPEGKQFIYKHKGDFVPEAPSSVASRIAVVVKKASLASAEDAEKLLIGSEKIKFWKDIENNY